MRFGPIDVLFVACALLALRGLLVQGLEPVGAYDEGLLFTNAQMMDDGRVLYRDFYAIYPPAIFQLVRAVSAVTENPIWWIRFLTFWVRLLSALGTGWLVGRARGAPFCIATTTAVLLLQEKLGLVAYAYTFAVLLGLVIIGTWPEQAAPRWRRVASGALFGLLSYLRHDMFVYVFAQLIAFEAISWFVRKRSLLFANRRALAEFTLSVAAVAMLLWTPLLLRTGISRPLHDILLDLGDVMKARVLPIPPLFEQVYSPLLNMNLPALMGERLRLMLLVSALAVLGACYAAYRALRAAPERPDATSVAAIALALAVTTVPQSLGRTDHWHVAFGIPLVLCAGLGVFGRVGAQLVALVCLLPWFTEGMRFIHKDELQHLLAADDRSFFSPERQQVASFVQAETKPGEPIFVGCSAHNRLIVNPLDVYYWAHRPGATRNMQFDPGMATTAKGQRAMIADLERTKPRLVLRYPGCLWDEPNESRREGATLLDEYLSRHYTPGEIVGSFVAWRRNSG